MIEQALRKYGYFFEFMGTLVEGDATILTAAFLARRGYFRLVLVVFVAFVATALMNQFLFELGKLKGPRWLGFLPKAAERIAMVRSWIDRYGAMSVFASRFVIGFRTVMPLACGALGMPRIRFTAGNVSGALAWAVVFGGAGYAGSHILTLVLDDIRKHEILIAAGIAIGTLAILAWRRRTVMRRIPSIVTNRAGV